MSHQSKAPSGLADAVPAGPGAVDAVSPPGDAEARRRRWPSRIDIGRIVKPHGVRGEVALEIWGEIGESLRPGSALQMGGAATQLVSMRGADDRVIARLAGLDDRDAAEDARGQVLSISSDGLPMPAAGEEYLFELSGCLVEVEQGDAVIELGHVGRVIEDGGGLLLEIGGRESMKPRERRGPQESPLPNDEGSAVYLVPYVSAYLRHKDLSQGVLRFALPEGLLETCVSTS